MNMKSRKVDKVLAGFKAIVKAEGSGGKTLQIKASHHKIQYRFHLKSFINEKTIYRILVPCNIVFL